MTFMVLNGTAIAGQKDHAAHAGSSLLGAARTAARYRCFAVRDEFPGLYPQPNGGRMVHAMLLVPSRLAPGDLIVDISEPGGIRAHQRFLAANARVAQTPGADPPP